ncbi:MAG: ArgR family transcriptional regulator [Spirochaetales bacterium]|jgi:transcriptional regulator of arginine metabolism|nr:ArgR family transcriptional regulator [Spirochaetales bacterium]
MKDKQARHQVIKHHIRNSHVSSQDDLLAYMHEQGFDITQATLSRDLKSLRLAKVYDGISGYYYSIPSEEQVKETFRLYSQDLMRGWLSIQFSGNLGVVKTMPGHANSVAVALDNLEIHGLLGTVAGDDTILLVLEEDTSKDDLQAELEKKVPEIGEQP